jgi:adenosylhomocysteine nucleosidase
MPVGIVVGLAVEARLARALGTRVAIGGGTAAGAAAAAERLIAGGAWGLISFGFAGGLDPRLRAGAIVIPRIVHVHCAVQQADCALLARLGGPTAERMLAGHAVAARTEEKTELWRTSNAAAIDLESGAVAETARKAGRPFAVLRAISDPAGRTLPPAALSAVGGDGRVSPAALLRSLVRYPRQVGSLLATAHDFFLARRALAAKVRAIGRLD